MQANPLLHHILDDDALTRGLGDEEARVLVEWLVERAEYLNAARSAALDGEQEAEAACGALDNEVRRLCRRGRAIARFVALWGQPGSRGAATQLAAVERFHWPLPPGDVDPCELMQDIVEWENTALGG
jgi:hypothetical protein